MFFLTKPSFSIPATKKELSRARWSTAMTHLFKFSTQCYLIILISCFSCELDVNNCTQICLFFCLSGPKYFLFLAPNEADEMTGKPYKWRYQDCSLWPQDLKLPIILCANKRKQTREMTCLAFSS